MGLKEQLEESDGGIKTSDELKQDFVNESFNRMLKAYEPQESKSLRDEFAMSAMNAYLSMDVVHLVIAAEKEKSDEYCKVFYAWADSMLEARKA